MKNVKDLRKELAQVFDEVKEGKTEVPKAKVMVATGNAILKSVQLELEQNKLTGEKDRIDWLS